jgi:hypothetical protein
MKDPDFDTRFPWTLFFFVTGASFLVFCLMMELMSESYSSIFTWIGIGFTAAGLISLFIAVSAKYFTKKDNRTANDY